ncbi:MAG: hypothetical protein KDD84_14340, partial [Caldilineaceae bacterium]|nr:hypothetical protein [Caldilineaceae bacterium]
MFQGRRGRRNRANDDRPTPDTPVNWRRLLAYLKPYRGRMALAIGALAISSAMGLTFPLVIVQLLDSVLKQQNMTQLNFLTVALIGVFLVQAVFTLVQSYTLNFVGENIVLDLRSQLYQHLQRMSLAFYADRRVGEIISRVSSDVTQVRTLLTNNATQLLSSVVSLIGSVVIVFLLNPRLVVFVLVLV